MVNKDNNHVEKNSEISKIQISENNIIRNNVEDKKFDEAVLKDEKNKINNKMKNLSQMKIIIENLQR